MIWIGRHNILRVLLMALIAAVLAAAVIELALPRLQSFARRAETHRTHGAAPRHPHPKPGRPDPLQSVGDDVLPVLEKLGVALGLLAAGCTLVAGAGALRRLHARRCRVYRAYQIHLTANDQTELQAMVQAIGTMGQAVAALPGERWAHGQPAFGLLVGYDPRDGGEVTLALICEEQHIASLDGALIKAFPNVRVGFEFRPDYQPLELSIGPVPTVMRLRKHRAAYHPIVDVDEEAERLESVIEGLADAMHTLRSPAAVWYCIVPTDTGAGYLRARHRQTERLRRGRERTVDGDQRPEASVDREETRQSAQISERRTFYVDVQIAAESYRACKALSGTLQNLPGAMNTLDRRPMVWRRGLYRRRFASHTPPLIMRGQAKLFTAAELACLMQLPSARLQAPIKRIPEPRLPASPAVASAVQNDSTWRFDPAAVPAEFEPLDPETMHKMLGTSRRQTDPDTAAAAP